MVLKMFESAGAFDTRHSFHVAALVRHVSTTMLVFVHLEEADAAFGEGHRIIDVGPVLAGSRGRFDAAEVDTVLPGECAGGREGTLGGGMFGVPVGQEGVLDALLGALVALHPLGSVVRLVVGADGRGCVGPVGADGAGEGRFVEMCAGVCLKFAWSAEAFGAEGALVRRGSAFGMHSSAMSIQAAETDEHLVAIGAGYRARTGMVFVAMDCALPGCGESQLAPSAWVGTVQRDVRRKVGNQGRQPRACVGTGVATERERAG